MFFIELIIFIKNIKKNMYIIYINKNFLLYMAFMFDLCKNLEEI